MINSVRNTVLSILNKNNYGYVTPQDFNLYAKVAQLEIFENIFDDYNDQVNQENLRASGTGYADLRKSIEESIESFSEKKSLNHIASSFYSAPSESTTGDIPYLLNTVYYLTTYRTSGILTSLAIDQVNNTAASFLTTVSIGDIVVNSVTLDHAEVMSVVSDTQLLISENIFEDISDDYYIYADESRVCEKIVNSKSVQLNNSLLTAPSTMFPAYSLSGDKISVYPKSINRVGQLWSEYIRYPRDPQWTYTSLSGGEPVFNQSVSTYQDFELPKDYEVKLIVNILSQCGMQIRETEIVQYSNMEEQKEKQGL